MDKTTIFIISAAIAIAVLSILLYSKPGAVEENTARNASSVKGHVFTLVPGEKNLIYLNSTKAVHEVWHNDTYYGYAVDSIIPFAPAYGYGGTYVYFLPNENRLVNEAGVEVPGIIRKVGDRP